MFKVINRVYLLASIFLYFILAFKIYGDYSMVIVFAIFNFISYFIILQYHALQNGDIYTQGNNNLVVKVFLYLFISIGIENFISYYYRTNFFLFNESDALFYHRSVLEIINMPFFDGLSHYLSFMGVDDLGMILILYPLYQITVSNLIVNLFYVVVGVISALSIFKLSQNFMSKRYAFFTSLAYSLSSFVIFFHGTGLKESFMVMIVILSFDFYYRFIDKKDISYLIIAIAFAMGLILFRPMILAMIIGSIGLSFILSKDGNFWTKLFFILVAFAFIFLSSSLTEQVNDYTTGGVDSLISARESQGGIIGGVFFTYIVNIISQTLGPLPTIISMSRVGTMFYTSGLIYRVLLSFPFWAGIFYIYKTKNSRLYPLALFIFMEMSALAYLIDGLELRKALPHIPFVYIIAFWFMDRYDREIIKIRRDKSFRKLFWTVMVTLTLMICFWNLR